MLGYKAIFDPYGDTLRRTLKHFYEDGARRADAEKYFRDFRNSVKIITNASQGQHPADHHEAFPFDTLHDREVLVHLMPSKAMFAVTCIFKINDATIAVTLPQSFPNVDPALVLDWYQKCAENPMALSQSVHRGRFTGTSWNIEKTSQKIGLLPD